MSQDKRSILTLYAIVLLGFALRVYRIDAVPLRGDEAFTLQVWTSPLNAILRDVAPINGVILLQIHAAELHVVYE